ncbi:MAG: hypothetical protein Q9226_002875 [Calogaya cf. arnoldii]
MDAIITQKAFSHWYHSVFLPSDRGSTLSQDARGEIHNLIKRAPPNPIDHSRLYPETIEVISIWENEPIPTASPQWRVARVRLIADCLLDQTFRELKSHQLLAAATVQEVWEARCWIYMESHERYDRYPSLAQPWCTKEVPWPYYDDTQVKLAKRSKALKSLPTAWTFDAGMEEVRMSMEKFIQLVGFSGGFPTPERNDARKIFEEEDQYDVEEAEEIIDSLEVAEHRTSGRVDEGWTGKDGNQAVMPDMKDLEPDPGAFSSPWPAAPKWTPINGPQTG